jgi:hypothetical protein
MDKQKDKWEQHIEELEACSIEELEKRIVVQRQLKRDYEDEVRTLLRTRQWKLRDTFTWTPEAVQRIIHINDLIVDCWDRLIKEAATIYSLLEARKASGTDPFLHDYGIECKIRPVYIDDNNEEEIVFWALTDMIDNIQGMQFSYEDFAELLAYREAHPELTKEELSMYEVPYLYSYSCAYETPMADKEEFANVRINNVFHELYDHCCWSMQDILNIKELWGEVIVTRQHFIENI